MALSIRILYNQHLLSNLRKEVRKNKIRRLTTELKESYGEVDMKLVDFINQLESYGFFLNMENLDIDYCLEENIHSIPILTANNVSVGIDGIYAGKIRVGIDPKYFFNKTGDCSIIAYFPMSKREYTRFLNLFNKIMCSCPKTFKKEWMKEALSSWCGSYATFGI